MVAGQLPVLALPILASALFPPAQVGYATIAMLIAGLSPQCLRWSPTHCWRTARTVPNTSGPRPAALCV